MIEFESVSKTFRDGTAAVVDLSLSVPSDKITVIVGPSGCGKTTTLRMVNRMLEPTSGRIVWDGSPLKSKRKTTLRRQMGYVIQSGGLFPHRTVIENIGTVPGLLGWSKDKIRKRSMELLASVGLDRKLAHRYPAQLSGGQQQRVGVARALAADPLVLLMDEPFSAVDPVVRSELHEFFLGLQRQISKTIILITHDIDEAIKLGDQVAILRVGGRLAQVGTPQQLLEEPADAFVEGFIGKDRGFRSLSFLPADGLHLDRVDVVRQVESAGSDQPTLVVDGDARPIGWAHPDQPGQVLALGATFMPEVDTMRAALDSALTSPYGLAVAVAPDTGRFAGVVSAQEILGQVAEARTAAAESIELRPEPAGAMGAEPELRPEPEQPESELSEADLSDPELGAELDDEPEGGASTSSARDDDDAELRSEPREAQEGLRPELVEGPEGDQDLRPVGEEDLRPVGQEDLHPELVEGPEGDEDLRPVGREDLRPEPVEGPSPEPWTDSDRHQSTGSTRIDGWQLGAEPVDEPEGDREPDRDHVR